LSGTQNQKLVGRLNHLVSLFSLTSPAEEEYDRCRTFFEELGEPLYLIGENRERFQICIDQLLNSIPSLKDTVSIDFVVDRLIPLIREKKISGNMFSASESEAFRKSLCDVPLQGYRVIRPIYGMDMEHDAGPFEFGDFRIDFCRRILTTDEASPILALVVTPEDHNRLFIQCTVSARDTATATLLADAVFYRFELVFRFFIGRRTDWVEVGIVNHKGAQMRGQFIFSEDGRPIGHGSSWKGAMQPFILGHLQFPQPSAPIRKLFELLTRPNNEFEKHVIRCAEWTGQAISEPNEAAALVKAAIALEVLFSANQKGLITPSIMAQIAESCAFLLADERNSPEEIERKVKDLYGVRSAVVHSGKDSVDTDDLNTFIGICRRVVIVLLSKEEFVGVDSMAKLASYFRTRKYAGVRTAETPVAT
jgi:hypothetical protein